MVKQLSCPLTASLGLQMAVQPALQAQKLAEVKASVQHAQTQLLRKQCEIAKANAAYRAIHRNDMRQAEAAKERLGKIVRFTRALDPTTAQEDDN